MKGNRTSEHCQIRVDAGQVDAERFAKSLPLPRFCSPLASKNGGGAVGGLLKMVSAVFLC